MCQLTFFFLLCRSQSEGSVTSEKGKCVTFATDPRVKRGINVKEEKVLCIRVISNVLYRGTGDEVP